MKPLPFLNTWRTCMAASLLALAVSPWAGITHAQTPTPAIFKDADLALGDKLVKEHNCSGCHIRKFGGDGTVIYRPTGRINTPGFLRGMVEQCNSELNLGLFPDEVTAVAAVLNRDHYRFK